MDNQEEEEEKAPTKLPPNPKITDCISLYELMPVSKIDKNIEAISSLIYEKDDLFNEFLQKVDDRLSISTEDSHGPFIKCEYNRDNDSYRSHRSNIYYPPLSNCRYPSNDLRILEEYLNSMFTSYASAYYSSSANSSVYCWNLGKEMRDGFCCAVLISNIVKSSNNDGVWNSNNVMTVTFSEKGGKINGEYKLISTVMLSMGFSNALAGKVDLSGTCSKKNVESLALPKGYLDYSAHVANIGTLIEDMETSLRNSIETIYVMKSKEIIGTARYNLNMQTQNTPQLDDIKKAFISRQGN